MAIKYGGIPSFSSNSSFNKHDNENYYYFFCKKTETHLKDCETSSVIRKIKKNIKHLLIFAKKKTNFSISRNWHQNVAAIQRTLSLILNMTLSIKITTLMFI